jgi:signal transduction histidine kinase
MITPPNANPNHISQTFEDLMKSDERSSQSSNMDIDGQASAYKVPPTTAIVDSAGDVIWESVGYDNALGSLISSHAQELLISEGGTDPGSGNNSSASINESPASERSVSTIQKITLEDNRVEEYLIVISDPFLASPIGSNEQSMSDEGNNNRYYVMMAIPLSSIFENVDDILLQQRIQTFSLVAAISVITIAMAFFINRSNRLSKEALEKAQKLEESNKIINQQQQELERSNKELDRINQELRQLDKAKDQFISIASHELKNPIQPILSYAEFGKRGTVDKDKAFDVILTNAKRLKKLASDLLDVTKIDSNNLSYDFAKFILADLIFEVSEAARPLARPDVKLEVVFDDEIDSRIAIGGDRTRLFQVFANLLNNALKFTERGFVRITVSKVDRDRGLIAIIIRDTGLGIPEEILPSLFGKFVSSSGERNNREGTGLGLYIAKSIIKAHGGDIEARNNPDGHSGAEFRVILPIASNNDIQSSRQSILVSE